MKKFPIKSPLKKNVLRLGFCIIIFAQGVAFSTLHAQPEPVTDPPYQGTYSGPPGWWMYNPPHKEYTDEELSFYISRTQLREIESEWDATAKMFRIREAQERLEDYRKSTNEKTRDPYFKVHLEKLSAFKKEALEKLEAKKEQERLKPAPEIPKPTLLGLWKRITSDKLPFPFTPRELSALAGIPLFVSGPHIEAFDLRYFSDFGHYNPKFIEWAQRSLLPRDGKFYQETASILEDALWYHAQYLLEAAYYLDSNPKVFAELSSAYKKALSQKNPFLPRDDIEVPDGPCDGPDYAYWLRRDIDGTATAVRELLELLLEAYRPNMLIELQRKYKKSQYALIPFGNYHRDEVEVENGDKVFSLRFGEGQESKLENDIIDIETFEDAVMDEPGKATGKTVSLKSKPEGEVLILLGKLTPGPLKIVSIPPLEKCVQSECKFALGEKTYTLKVAAVERIRVEYSEEATPAYLIELSDGAQTKVLNRVRQIAWAGDLDRDGKLDLIYNVFDSSHLLLSSRSALTLMMEVAANYPSSGC